MRRTLTGLVVALASAASLACPGNPPTPLTTTLNPSVRDLAIRQGLDDANNDCSVATPPSPPAPNVWFNALPISAPQKTVNNGIVGFNVWRNTHDGCLEARQDLYRTRFAYDLSGIQNLKGLVTAAQLSFAAVVLPAPSGIFCQAMTGGGGSLFRLPVGTALPAAMFTLLPLNSSFTTTGRVFGMTNPWIAGTIQPGVTTLATGTGGASLLMTPALRITTVGRLRRAAGGSAAGVLSTPTSSPSAPSCIARSRTPDPSIVAPTGAGVVAAIGGGTVS